MKTTTPLLINGLALVLFLSLSIPTVNAQSTTQCICHNVLNNPVEVCSDDDSYKEGHGAHLESGFDTYEACPTITATPTPTVAPSPTGVEPTPTTGVEPTPTDVEPTPAIPEFGLMTGLVTLAVSTGSYLMLKKKV